MCPIKALARAVTADLGRLVASELIETLRTDHEASVVNFSAKRATKVQLKATLYKSLIVLTLIFHFNLVYH